MGQAAMRLESEPGKAMGIACGQQASIPVDWVDDKIRRQMNPLLEVPEEHVPRPARLALAVRQREANRKGLQFAQIPHNLHWSPETSENSEVLYPLRRGQAEHDPTAGLRFASSRSKGASSSGR